VYATLFDNFPRPIPAPIENLRPAQETCNQCHWPREFVGDLDRTYNFFLGDQTNTPFSVSLVLKVGGGDPTHGPVGGIHWHMSISNRVEYIAADEARQKIPWVRLTDQAGVVTVFCESTFTNDINRFETRKMDCMDCHNRPAHRFTPPDRAVDLAIARWATSIACCPISRATPFAAGCTFRIARWQKYPNRSPLSRSRAKRRNSAQFVQEVLVFDPFLEQLIR
jgi:hypothetical protein